MSNLSDDGHAILMQLMPELQRLRGNMPALTLWVAERSPRELRAIVDWIEHQACVSPPATEYVLQTGNAAQKA